MVSFGIAAIPRITQLLHVLTRVSMRTMNRTKAQTHTPLRAIKSKFIDSLGVLFGSVVMRHASPGHIQRQGQFRRGVRLHVRVLVEVRRVGLGGVAELATLEPVIVSFYCGVGCA